MKRYLAAVVFALTGACLCAINAISNAITANHGRLEPNDVTAIICGLAVTGALLSVSLAAIACRSRGTALLAIAVITGCAVTSLGYTLKRVGGFADTGTAAAVAHNAAIQRQIERIDELRRAVDEERRRGGCRTICHSIQADLRAAEQVMTGLGARQSVDSAGERLEAISGGLITAHGYQITHPAIVAATLEVGSALLLTVAGLFATGGQCTGRHGSRVIDITPEPVDQLLALLEREQRAMTNGQVAQALGISAGAASQRIKRLAEAGQVERRRIGRAVAVRLR